MNPFSEQPGLEHAPAEPAASQRGTCLVFDLYLEHLEQIKDGPTFAADLGVYLTDESILAVDAIALRGRGEVD